MQCDSSNRCYVNTYPDVHCSFEIMDRCMQYSEADMQQACREGVRDAHLLRKPSNKYTEDQREAYEAGNFTCFHDCLQRPIHVATQYQIYY